MNFDTVLLGTIGYHSLSTSKTTSRASSKASKPEARKPRKPAGKGRGYTIPEHGYYIDARGRERELRPYRVYNISYRVKGIDFPDIISISGKLITADGARIATRYPQDLTRERSILSREKKNRRWRQRLHRKGIGV